MSDLKHRTATELRKVIEDGRKYADRLSETALANDATALRLRAEASHVEGKAMRLRNKLGAIEQRIEWARKYLAEKETDNA